VNWKRIFRDAVSGVAGVVVYDKGAADALGRYVVAKSMKLAGSYRDSSKYFFRREAAIRCAKKFLEHRAKKAGTKYTPGDGANTIAFKPEGVQS
jgi:hypothetical protein